MKITQLLAITGAITLAAALPGARPATRIESIPGAEARAMQARQEGAEGADGIISLILLVEDLIRNEHNAYDADQDSSMCAITFSTYAGSDCAVQIACGGNQQRANYAAYPAILPGPGNGQGGGWNVCFKGGVQSLHFDGFGDFSIEFSEAGGVDGNTKDGLHTPILRVASIGNWEPIDVQQQADRSVSQNSGNICTNVGTGDGKWLMWTCSLPMIGSQYAQLSNNPGVTATSYAGGSCGIHFVDYQIPSGDNQYYVALRIVDNNGQLIGQVGNSYSIGEDRVGAANPVDIDSLLPWVLIYTRHGPDDTMPSFAYAGQNWDAGSGNCKVGGFDSGSRQGDCTFSSDVPLSNPDSEEFRIHVSYSLCIAGLQGVEAFL